MLGLEGRCAGLEETFGNQQDRNQGQNKDRFRRVVLPIFRRDRVARGPEDTPSNGGDHDREKNQSSGIVFDDIVEIADAAGKTGHYKVIGDPNHHQGNGAKRQHQKTGKENNVQESGEQVARLFPLHQPEFQYSRQAGPHLGKPKVGGATKQRRNTFQQDEGEARHPQQGNNRKQESPRNNPVCRLRG